MTPNDGGKSAHSSARGKSGSANGTRGKKKKKNSFDIKKAVNSVIKNFAADSNAEPAHEKSAETYSVDSMKIGEKIDTSHMGPTDDVHADSNTSARRRVKHSSGQKSGSDSYKVKGGKVEGKSLTFAEFMSGYLKKAWVRVMLAVSLVFLMMYVVYQIYLNYYSDVKTEIATITTYSETIDTQGVAIRDEIIIDEKLSGTAVSAVENGAKVSKGQTVINVFSSANAASAYKRITEIDEEISELQSMTTASEDSATEVSNIEKQLDEQVSTLAEQVNKGDLSNVAEIKNNITYLMNKRLIAMRKVEDYQDRIDELTKEKQSLEAAYSKLPSTITAPVSGHYVNSLDGYENLLDTSMLSELTASELNSIMSREVTVPENSAGKLMQGFSWYLACPVSAKNAEDYLQVDSVYTLILPYSQTGSLKATLVYLNEGENDEDDLLAVFQCYSLLSELCTMRSQPVKIQIRSYKGFNVKKSALHVYEETIELTDDDGKKTGETKEVKYPCVYVIVGNQVVARRVNVLYNGDKFVICSSSQSGSGYLTLYDKVITEGKGLYAGKIIN